MSSQTKRKKPYRKAAIYPNFPYLFDDEPDEGSAENLPAITVTGQGLRIEGSIAEFDRLILILGEWMK